MPSSTAVFLDANVFIYLLDETSSHHSITLNTLQNLVDNETEIYTSHHVIEEVLFIVSKLTNTRSDVEVAVQKIVELPTLNLIEPDTDLGFVSRYSQLWKKTKLGINDALLLQLMLDAGIGQLFSFDNAFLKQAAIFGIGHISTS